MRRLKSKIALWIALLAFALPVMAGEIHEAVNAGDAERVAALLRDDPALASLPDEADRFQSAPLHMAAWNGHLEIAELLLAAGAAIGAGDTDESTPLHVAALHRQPEMVIYLIERGADVNRRDRNGAYSLSFAASAGDSACVQILLEAGADLNHITPQGITLLHYASSRGLDDLFDLLVARGHDVRAGTVEGSTPLHWTARSSHVDMVAKLMAAGAVAAAVDSSGATPLIDCSWRGNLDMARALMDIGVDPNRANDWGVTPLFIASRGGNREFSQLLLDRGADPNLCTNQGECPLYMAANEGDAELVALLMAAGARSDMVDARYGFTPLHVAAIRGFGDVTGQLLAAGAAVNAKDVQDRTPVQLAAAYGHGQTAQLLRDAGGQPRDLKIQKRGLASCPELDKGEAMIWYLGHSGWAIKTKKHLLVFDYHDQGRMADQPGLCNGHIAASELAGERVTVFASHEHGDHYDPMIFDWREDVPRINYVLGCQPDSVPPCTFVAGREETKIDGMKVSTIESNDTGVGFWIEVDGLTILHPGDHANRQRDFSGPFQAEIDWLAAKGKQPDLCFAPISGCGFGDQVAVKMGVEYMLETLEPIVFFPMHGGANSQAYREFITEAAPRFPAVQMEAPFARGDRFHYKGGGISL